MRAKLLIAVSFAMSLGLYPAPGAAVDIPDWPAEQAERLEIVDQEILRVQRELSISRRRGELDGTDDRREHFAELRNERLELRRALRLER